MKGRSRIAGALAGVLVLAGCSDGGFNGLYGTPLPGGADVGDHPYHVTALFTDVLDLVPQSSVKVNDVAVGRVDKITLTPDTRSALVAMTVNGDIALPVNARAELKQSSLLGEKFVELSVPTAEPATGKLADGGQIPLGRTNRNPEVEEVLGALSLLLNGGGVEQIQKISHELNDALSGNEPEIRALLSRVDELATQLDGHKTEILRAIDGLAKLSHTLTGQTQNLTNALDNLAPGLKVVTDQRDQLVGMLNALNTLSGVAVDTVTKSRDQLVANLKALQPTLAKLGEAGQNLPNALQILLTYPFPDYAGNVIKGDYANVEANVNLDLDTLISNFTNSSQPPIALPSGTGGQPTPVAPPLPLPDLGSVPPAAGPGLLGGLLGLIGGGR
ncbi:ABC transporter substrate-binding protein [Amycolatopsis mediterranei S699]|uniref:ABC transport system substrate-binding protein n=2 Tax=Amycolatopsis mediterranei TaxID=33910 RepID=A0A0H3D3W8_AMYMU|nr:MCE family protein [Amycolatopsis mediterranei]ADJ44228.1 ABC transport system substrate-binding protein [Amycolatopsis mediterranei U32]AEK40964.1 ABC transporter substrate-binding protein [Amycolatopsis mediterranei S699]AFO75941.1 ABC transporter substrate-binding protein [Amycolatopsis mediterranei S699]AGT83070.1 ABC transporter substrate-binding protein [Amycolatopsis mediterranei RB]KDO06855.1 ABC transporter substrate-binding protein [Amycolatopsis mediterranei]